MLSLRRRVGDRLAEFLTKPRPGSASVPVEAVGDWTRWLRPCDVLLVEGSSRIATAIKYRQPRSSVKPSLSASGARAAKAGGARRSSAT
jgi:hypothetical protein